MARVVLDNVIFALQRAGGISVVWQNIIQGVLRNDSFAKSFIEYENSNIFRSLINIPDEMIINDSLGPLNIKRYLNPKMGWVKEPFIFHSSYYRTTPNPAAKNITTVHDFTYDYFSHGLAKKVHCTQRNRAIMNSDVVVCISENTRNDLLKFVPEARGKEIRIVYNGVSEDYRPLSAKTSGYEDHIMFVGARGGYKNFEFAVHAVKRSPFKLLICGNPLSKEEAILLEKELGSERYKTVTRPTNETLNEFYNSAHCLLYPSSYEGFGIPVLEAQRAGCPVIALNASSIPEIIGERTLLMDSLTAEQFAAKIALISNPQTRDHVVSAGIENSKEYSWDKMADNYLDIYKEVSSN